MKRLMMEPGEIMLNDNPTLLHARTGLDDYPEPEHKRHMLRLWMDAPSLRPVVPEIDPYQQPASGGRGGVAKQVAA